MSSLTYFHEEFEGTGLFSGCLYDIKLTDILFSFTPSERGSRDSMGVPLEPDWPEEIEFTGAQHEIRKHDDEGDTFLLAPDSPESAAIFRMFCDKHSQDVEDYIMDNA